MRIAISGLTGCGNSTASELVSKALGLKKYNYTFHDLARDLKIPFQRLHELAERDQKYDFMLDRKQIEFALREKNCVVGTRLAVFLDKIAPKLKLRKPKFDLKVWLDAPLEVRAKRIAVREGGSFGEALAEVKYRDGSNAERYMQLYGLAYSMPSGCLKLDAKKLEAIQISDSIVNAARKIA